MSRRPQPAACRPPRVKFAQLHAPITPELIATTTALASAGLPTALATDADPTAATGGALAFEITP